MSIIPGENARYGLAEILVYTSGNAPGMASVIIPGNLILNFTSASWGLLSGTVLGRETATGYYKPCVKTANDGSEVPIAILHRNVGTNFDTFYSTGDIIPISVMVHGTIQPNGLSEAHVDSSWGINVADAVKNIAAQLRKVGIFLAEPGHWSWSGNEQTQSGATVVDGQLTGLVEIVILQGFGAGIASQRPLVTIFDRASGSVIQPPNGYRLLIDRMSAKSLVSANAAVYV